MILAIVENAFLSLIGSAIPASAVVMLAATGAMLGERVGVLNLGQEGLIGVGAVFSVIAVLSWGVESPWLAMLIGMIAAAVMGLIFAIAVVGFRASQVLVGLALALGGIGLSNQLGVNRNGTPIQTLFREVNPGGVLDDSDAVAAFFFHDPVVYIAYIGLPVVLWFVLFRTRHGMNMRAVGENPAAADAVGVSVTGWRIFYSVLGAALTGAGGAYMVLSFTAHLVARHRSRPGLGGAGGGHLRGLAAGLGRGRRAAVRVDDLAGHHRPGPGLGPAVHGGQRPELLPVDAALRGDPGGHPHPGGGGEARQKSAIHRRARRAGHPLLPRGALSATRPGTSRTGRRGRGRG